MLAREPHHEVLGVVVVIRVADQLDRGVDQERTEDVEDPGELLNRDRAERDEDAAEDQRQDDADQQRLLLILLRHVEARHDDQEDEQVVDGQAVLRQPAGEELHTELAAVEEPHPQPERHREPDVDRQAIAHLAVVGSWGRRPIKTTSNKRTATVTPRVMAHSS